MVGAVVVVVVGTVVVVVVVVVDVVVVVSLEDEHDAITIATVATMRILKTMAANSILFARQRFRWTTVRSRSPPSRVLR